MITNKSGTVVKQKQYEAFGNLKWESGTFSDNREFTSKEKDPTGFHYFPFRYYSADIGIFLSPDPHTLTPAGLTLGIPQSLNPYVYSRNNPLKYVDLMGLSESPVSNKTNLVEYWEWKQEMDIINQYGSGSIIYYDEPSWLQPAAADVTGAWHETKDYYFVSQSATVSYRIFSLEGGVFFLVDPSTWEYYWWTFFQLGPGVSAKVWDKPVQSAAIQTEVGRFSLDARMNPAHMCPHSITASGFTAAQYKGVGGQATWSLSGGHGWTVGHAGGFGAGISIMYTYSWYQGSGSVVPDYIKQLLDK